MKQLNKISKVKKTQTYCKGKLFAIAVGSCFLISTIDMFAQETNKEEKKDELVTWKAEWKDGFIVKSSDKKFSMKFGGRIMNDWVAALSQDDSLTTLHGKAINGTEFRRARFFNSGTIYNNVQYKLQFDFAGNGTAVFKDVYIQLAQLPVIGNLKVGHFKEPFGLEELTSSKYITFMERSLTSPFIPVRNTGFMAFNHAMDEKLTWALGVFRDADDYGEADDSYIARHNITGRVTVLPLYDKEHNKLIHLGVAYTMRNPDNNQYKLASSAESHMQHKFVSTGTINDVDAVGNLGTELAVVMGQFSLQSEYIRSSVKRTTQDTSGEDIDVKNKFSGFYAMVSFFLTKGDHRSYKTYGGAFSRVKPKKNFGDDSGIGAFELSLRFSGLDLIDGLVSDYNFVDGGTMSDITFGLNWYLNPATRVMMNYVSTIVKGSDPTDVTKLNDVGSAGFYQMRFQIDF